MSAAPDVSWVVVLLFLGTAALAGLLILCVRRPAARVPILTALGVLAVVAFVVLPYVSVRRHEYEVARGSRDRVAVRAGSRDGHSTADGVVTVSQSASSEDGRVQMRATDGLVEPAGRGEHRERAPTPAPSASGGSARKEPATPPLPGGDSGARAVAPGPAEHRVALPDDLAEWRRVGEALPFEAADAHAAPGWVEDGASMTRRTETVGHTRFAYWAPGPGDHLVAYSEQEATPQAALEAARRLAARKLGVLVLKRLEAERPGTEPDAVLPLVRALAGRPEFWQAEGEHLERAVLPISQETVHRAAVRIAAGTERVAGIARIAQIELERGWAAAQARLRRRVWQLTAGGLLAFVVFAGYAFVNARTRGQFAWPLRIAALVALAAMLGLGYAVFVVG